jgi:hypothetical protein
VQIHGNDTVFQITMRLSRWLVKKWNATEKPHPCRTARMGHQPAKAKASFNGKKSPTAKARSFRRISKREVSQYLPGGPNRERENLSKDTNERKR